MDELKDKVANKTPYDVVVLQESERMNILVSEIKRSLVELQRGLKGELNITDLMEVLQNCLNANKVPDSWTK